ncbi:MAG: hypothetical protein ACI4GW_00250 [Lachnospiraceae bacterium]
MKNRKKVTAVFLAGLMVVAALPASAFAASENTQKEEVVYTNLNPDGSVKEINVVNIFDLKEKGQIIDYGNYESTRNMTTTAPINYENDTVTIEADKGKLYYEGKMEENEIPWNIEIQYFMDGKEYTAEEIAGMSGVLEIKMGIRKNRQCNSSFFKGYALQATFVLDTNHATDIKAEGATIANVGSDKQITFTILPNNEKDINISANVNNFEMDGISINGIRMDMDMDIDDSTLKEKIDEMLQAVNDLDNGAGELNDGASDLYGATGKLNTAAGNLYSGVGTLYDGANQLQGGLAALSSKNKELTGGAWSAYEGLCTAAQTQLNAQLTANGMGTVTLTPSTYSEVLIQVLEEMGAADAYNTAYTAAEAEVRGQATEQVNAMTRDDIYTQAALQQLGITTQEEANALLRTEEGINLFNNTKTAIEASMTEEQLRAMFINQATEQTMGSEAVLNQINAAVENINAAASQVSTLKGQLDSYGTFYNGLVDYTNGVSTAADGASGLTNGLSTLYSNTDIFKTAIGDLQVAVGTMKNGTNELKDGTGEFVDETANMNEEVDDGIDEITASLTGKDVETVSFVSEENHNIKSVLFVIKTENIKTNENPDEIIKEETSLSFWQKLLNLFHGE